MSEFTKLLKNGAVILLSGAILLGLVGGLIIIACIGLAAPFFFFWEGKFNWELFFLWLLIVYGLFCYVAWDLFSKK